jgi:cobalt-zinc-cadmium efflux system protein
VIIPELGDEIARARRLEWWTIGWTVSIILVMGAAMGGSQTMKTAWIEDVLTLIPPVVFLIATRFEALGPTARFPLGFQRVNSLAFLIAAVALAGVGATLMIDSVLTLIRAEHTTIGGVRLFGRDVWLGWIMVVAQIYSIIPPLILGRLKLPLAHRLRDKVLFTDAETQKANWRTGLAGIFGVLGIGLGWWWADAVSAAIIAVGILLDGIRALRSATAELVDGAPRALENCEIAEDARQLQAALEARFAGAEVRLRETGRVIRAQIKGVPAPGDPIDPRAFWPGPPDTAWRLAHLAFVPPEPERD